MVAFFVSLVLGAVLVVITVVGIVLQSVINYLIIIVVGFGWVMYRVLSYGRRFALRRAS